MNEQRNILLKKLLQYENDNPDHKWLHGVLSLGDHIEFDWKKMNSSLHTFFRGYLSVAYMDYGEPHNQHIHFMLANTADKIKRFEEKQNTNFKSIIHKYPNIYNIKYKNDYNRGIDALNRVDIQPIWTTVAETFLYISREDIDDNVPIYENPKTSLRSASQQDQDTSSVGRITNQTHCLDKDGVSLFTQTSAPFHISADKHQEERKKRPNTALPEDFDVRETYNDLPHTLDYEANNQ